MSDPIKHSLVISKLDGSHLREHFDCGKQPLNHYIKQLASQHQKRNIGRTFVLTEPDNPKVLGFYTLAASAVAFEHMPAEEKVPRYPIPVLRLAQLAVDCSIQKKGWGDYLLIDSLARAERISREAAVFAIEVDALDDDARSFYLKRGFSSLLDDRRHLYLPMKKIATLSLNE